MPKELNKKRNRTAEPEVTPEILSKIPDHLRNMLGEMKRDHDSDYKSQGGVSVLITSNMLAGNFVYEQLGIHSSQAHEFKDLYALVREHCRNVLKEILALEKLEWETEGDQYSYDVYEYDSIRENLLLEFVETPNDYLIYTTENGSQEKRSIYGNEIHIILEKSEIRSIDLTPLKVLTHLQHLRLSQNSIQSIDLTPLSSCSRLEELYLHINQLKSIDLTPLSSCYHLEKIDLTGNQLQHVDLTPLSLCSHLSELYLRSNQLQHVDLTPLSSCVKLMTLHLNSNQLSSIDLTPLSSCPKLRAIRLTENKLKSIDLTALKPRIKRCVRVDSTVQLVGGT